MGNKAGSKRGTYNKVKNSKDKNKPVVKVDKITEKDFTDIDTEKNLNDKLNEIKNASQSNEPLPRGNSLEDDILKKQDETNTGETNTGEQKERKKYSKRLKVEEISVDPLTLMLNSTLAPLIANKFKREVKEVMYTQPQMDDLKKLQPPSKLNEPSWVTYTMAAFGMMFFNFQMASKKVIEVEEIKEDETSNSTETRQSNSFNPSNHHFTNTDNQQ